LPRPALLLTPEAASTDAQGMSLRPAAILLVCAAAAALAQAPLPEKAPAATLPPALALPWRLIGIDPARAGTARPALEASERALAAAVLDAPKTLTELATPLRSVPLNGRRIADEIRAGGLKGKTGLLPLAIEPAWSSLLDHELLTVTVADAARNVLLGSAHVAVPRAQWPARGLDGFLGAQLTTLAGRALEQAAAHPLARPAATASDALHVGFSLGRDTTRRDEGPSHALTMLLEEQLAPRYTVARALGADKLALVRELLGLPSALRRPTRGFVLRWFHDPEVKAVELVRPSPAKSRGKPAAANFGKKLSRSPDAARAPSLPATLRLVATLADTVHGEHLADAQESVWELRRAPDGTIGFKLDPALEALLEREKKSLLAGDLPQAVKIDRAWVYVDRGRAWGLKIGDRLVARVGDKPDDVVKGHIVQYFGPELKLTSARGFPIQEGAVVYVRKNQSKARSGMIFQFDPATYPSPWPPKTP
jgi:hypothetical protein